MKVLIDEYPTLYPQVCLLNERIQLLEQSLVSCHAVQFLPRHASTILLTTEQVVIPGVTFDCKSPFVRISPINTIK